MERTVASLLSLYRPENPLEKASTIPSPWYFDQRIARHRDRAVAHDVDFEPVALGDAVDFVLDRTGVGIDVNSDRIGTSRCGVSGIQTGVPADI